MSNAYNDKKRNYAVIKILSRYSSHYRYVIDFY